MRKQRYTVHVIEQKKTKDFSYVITDTRTGDEIIMGGYATNASAWRGYRNAQKTSIQRRCNQNHQIKI
jgi:hypothetical protein